MQIEKNGRKTLLTINGITKDVHQWAEECGLKHTLLMDRLRNGVDEGHLFDTPRKTAEHIFNQNYFDVIDDEHKAYWLGFIYADGYIGSKHPTVGVELNHIDASHLEKFKRDLQSNFDIKIYNKNSTFGTQTNCRFAFNSRTMHNALLSLGITPTKSINGTFPTVHNKELIKDVIRGIFDGDGSIVYRIGANGYPIACIHFCGTMSVLKVIENYSGFKWSWSQRHPDKDVDNWQMCTGNQDDIISFLNYIYKDSTVYLDRKYQKYIDVVDGRKNLIDNRVKKGEADKDDKNAYCKD